MPLLLCLPVLPLAPAAAPSRAYELLMVVFDPETVRDRSTFAQPHQLGKECAGCW